MKTISLTVNEKEIPYLISKLSKYEIEHPNNEYIEGFYKYKNSTITLYKSKKLVIQTNNEQEIIKYLNLFSLNKKMINSIKSNSLLDNPIGCDEVGVGDYFGGIVTCAAYIPKENIEKVKSLKIDDSKKLTDNHMKKIYSDLIKLVFYSIQSIEPKEYNKMIAKFKNTHIIKTILHNNGIKEIKSHIGPSITVVMDQYVNEKKYYEYLNKNNIEPEKIDAFETKAESKYLSVAVASIIARVNWINQMTKLSKSIGFDLPYGSSNQKIIELAQHIANVYGKNELINYAKIDFRTTTKIMKLSSNYKNK